MRALEETVDEWVTSHLELYKRILAIWKVPDDLLRALLENTYTQGLCDGRLGNRSEEKP